ncbi:ABC transporter ATP-binding protein [Lacticaseibacillus parahuelsenbergensis]|uniref:ABC transporter ATP-binding protein n=1 Tax=Lacticaseibacillus parahuelsenbergensis TaxID=3068305 RepID=A0ABY9L2H2_9LACO|nr:MULTISPECIES: ABC transporter ATP-binding protein [Lacticaseibacillus]MDE3283824.1 ABC transporter ATP-binding protein [Lacticaseibacillus casei]WLV77952.1 ABC transporter ATP-binding protein [Lacticaseibacillus sp. NCIMB 15471]
MLKINHLAKAFKHTPVLTDVSLQAEPGELIHIAGENGSGKSTLFKIITGLLTADHGTVKHAPDDVIGALIENPGFLEFENVMTNLRFLAELNHRFDADRIKALLTQFHLDPASRQPVSKYSVGMRQKVGIIQAIMENQTVILLDEPTRGLDPDSIHQFINLMTTLKQEQKTVIVASHDHIDGLDYDQSLVLKNGQLANA